MIPAIEQILILEKSVEAAQAEAEKDAAGKGPSAFTGNQHLGAGRAFGILQILVFLHNQLASQRNHEKYAQPAADQRQAEDARIFEIESQEDQRGQRENNSGGDGLARIAGGLNNVVLKDGGAAEGAQNADGKYRDRN